MYLDKTISICDGTMPIERLPFYNFSLDNNLSSAHNDMIKEERDGKGGFGTRATAALVDPFVIL